MPEFPNPADLFAFVVVFFPGFISLSIAIHFHDIPPEKVGAVEKMVISFALSVLVFFLARVPVNFLTPSQALLSVPNLVAIFAVAIALGCALAVFYYVWIYVEFHVLRLANWIRIRAGLTLTPGTVLEETLDLIFDNRHRSHIVIADKKGERYRGFLGSVSYKPSIQLMIARNNNRNPERLENGVWKETEEWTLIFEGDNISWIGAVAV